MTTITKTTANAKFAFSKERYLEIMKTFSKFVNSPDIKPVYHEKGHKIRASKASFEVFIFHAMLQGKNPEITTHDANSENYTDALAFVLSKHSIIVNALSEAFGMSKEEVELVVDIFGGEATATIQATGAVFTIEKTIEACKTFRAFVKDEDNKPWKCEQYGTKYPGAVTHKHYILYAVLRGKNPSETSHAPESESFKEKVEQLKLMAKLSDARFEYSTDSYRKAFGLSTDEMKLVILAL